MDADSNRDFQRMAAFIGQAADEIRGIAQRLTVLSEDGGGRAMIHTEGVDWLIGCVDRLDYALSQYETAPTEAMALVGSACGSTDPDDPLTRVDLPSLCRDIRCKAADLDRLNRDGLGASSELGELAADLMRLEGELRTSLAALTQESSG